MAPATVNAGRMGPYFHVFSTVDDMAVHALGMSRGSMQIMVHPMNSRLGAMITPGRFGLSGIPVHAARMQGSAGIHTTNCVTGAARSIGRGMFLLP